jgi:hypothetical protein
MHGASIVDTLMTMSGTRHMVIVENNGQRFGSIYRAHCLDCGWQGELDWTANRAAYQHVPARRYQLSAV